MIIRLNISIILIIISIIFTFLAFYNQDLYIFWMNTYFLNNWSYPQFILQFFSSNFIHWWFIHLLFNSIFIIYFWTFVENNIWKNKYILFFILNAFFVWWAVLLFSNANNTVWISWFWLAVLTYYTLLLKEYKLDAYKWWITAILINIFIWLWSWISFVWHFFWAIFWLLFFIFNKKFTKLKAE